MATEELYHFILLLATRMSITPNPDQVFIKPFTLHYSDKQDINFNCRYLRKFTYLEGIYIYLFFYELSMSYVLGCWSLLR